MTSQAHSHILVAPSSYKGTLSAVQVAEAIAAGIRMALPAATIVEAPIADGGDDTLDAIDVAIGGHKHQLKVTGAIGQDVTGYWLELSKQQAVVELACSSGLGMLHESERRPLEAHTQGTGQMLLDCLRFGATEVYVCVGGSASTDGGSGLLHALGARFFNQQGEELSAGGGALSQISTCDLSALAVWSDVALTVATDVTSPLLGPHGAAHIFAPQKGASEEEVLLLDKALTKFADVLESATGRCARNKPGAGAAGGTAFGLACAMGAQIEPGFDWVAQLIDLRSKIEACDLVITGEGCLDSQSLVGKATGQLADLCRFFNKPLWVVPALCANTVLWQEHGIERVEPVSKNGVLADAQTIAQTVHALLLES